MSQALLRKDMVTEPPASDRLSRADFGRIATLVGEHTGIKLPQAKQLMVEGRLRKRMRAMGARSLTQYCRILFDEGGLDTEFIHLVDAVTTNKTDFFREPEHFACMERSLLPALLKLRSGANSKLKLWSAASSNGAEAYTMAMVMAEFAARNDRAEFMVLGTDISTRMLAVGEKAIYPVDMVGPVPTELQKRYLMRGRSQAFRDAVRIVPELRRRVRFLHLNLMDQTYPVDRDIDIIFLRNVLIYFEKETQEAVVQRLVGHLRPGGYIILGHSESMIGTTLRLEQRMPGVFQKT